MYETWFATPALLWSLVVVPAALVCFVFGYVRRRQLTARLANAYVLHKSIRARPSGRRVRALCALCALALVGLASAGPQWGLDPDAQFRKGRDVVLVLDLSRSMFAEQPSRRTLAARALRHLADAFEDHGGNRVALVGFASRARIFFPLTQDCDHLRHTLDLIEADDYASLSEKAPASGTRLGAALKLAVDSCEAAAAQRPLIVLLSDGDDPLDDDEWLQGVNAAIDKQVRVCVVGVGNHGKAETIPVGRDLLEFEGETIRTKLNEERLREIARRTGGEYWPAHRNPMPLGAFVLHQLDVDELRAESAPASVPVVQLRYAWFLLPALVLLAWTMVTGDGVARRRAAPFARLQRRAGALVAACLAAACISAADPPDLETLVRQGDAAYASGEYEAAIGVYEKAEALTQDPGRLSFNKAAALYRLERYREAIDCYRRCLEDDAAPPERRARACFDLGNALVQQAGTDAASLAEAVSAYRAALHLGSAQSSWRADARHNLELAQHLWLQARVKQPPEKVIPPKNADKSRKDRDNKSVQKQKTVIAPVDPTTGFQGSDAGAGPSGQKSDKLTGGLPKVLSDTEKIVPLSPADTWATLEREAERIAAARRQQLNPAGPVRLSTKDW